MSSGSDCGGSDVWVVLVAGEHHSVSKALGGHSSITSIGDAYNTLRRHISRNRIIVIAQLDECRLWHDQPFEEKVKDVKDAESAERQRPMWAEKRVSFWKHLGQLIEEGGADYDGADVNPDTVLRVILGERSAKHPKVVEYEEGRTKLFFSLFGHGSWSGRNDNHYFYMPYPSHTVLQSLSLTIRPPEPPLPVALTDTPDIGGSSTPEGIAGATADAKVEGIETEAELPSDEAPCSDIPSQSDPGICTEQLEDASDAIINAEGRQEQLAGTTSPAAQSEEGLVPEPVTVPVTVSVAVPEEVPVSDLSPVEPDASSTPVHCEGLEDPLYLCINSHLPLSGGCRKPFRVHISRYPAEGKPPKSKEELDIQDASILHWQFLFEAFRQICTLKRPKSVFVFQQSCGSGGMWLWLKENAAYEQEYGCSEWPLFVSYTSEPETSAVGASWGVFFNLLAQALDRDGGGDTATRPSTLPSDASISQFYSTVTAEYYKVEPFVYHVNLELSEEDRAKQSYIKFGVLGTAHGVKGDTSECNIRTFFLD